MRVAAASFLTAGWVTAEYGMLPRATHTRGRREAHEGRHGGRSQEIHELLPWNFGPATDAD